MKLTSVSRRPGAAKPAVAGARRRISVRLSSTARRQKTCARGRSADGSEANTARIVNPEKIVSSTTASDRASGSVRSWRSSGAEPASR